MSFTRKEVKEIVEFSFQCGKSDKETVKSLLGKKFSDINGFNLRDTQCESYIKPLSSAVHFKNYKIAKLLLKLGANPNVLDVTRGLFSPNISPLYFAIINDDVDMVDLLLKFGATPNGWNITRLAFERGILEIAKLMLPKVKNDEIVFAMKIAVKFGYSGIIDYFFEVFAKNNQTFEEFKNVFFKGFRLACKRGEADIIRLFISRFDEKKLDYKKGFFEDGITYALSNEVDFDTIMVIFIKCDPNYVTGWYFSIISEAFLHKRFDFLRIFLDYCDFSVIDTEKCFLSNIFDEMCIDDSVESDFLDEDETLALLLEVEPTYDIPDFIESFKIIAEYCMSGNDFEKRFKHGFKIFNEILDEISNS